MKKKETKGPRESGLMRNKEEKIKRLGMGNAVLCSATPVLGLLCVNEGRRKKEAGKISQLKRGASGPTQKRGKKRKGRSGISERRGMRSDCAAGPRRRRGRHVWAGRRE